MSQISRGQLRQMLVDAIGRLFDGAEKESAGIIERRGAVDELVLLTGDSFAAHVEQLATREHVRCVTCNRPTLADFVRNGRCGACIVNARVEANS